MPNQKAVLDQQTGEIKVIIAENIKNESAWRRSDIVFRNTPLSQIIIAIEENYNINVKVNCKNCLDDKFTGTLPLNDLNEVLEVIEKSYHLKTEIIDKEILLSNK